MSDVLFEVLVEGVVEYQYFVVDLEFEDDVWIELVEVIFGDLSVVYYVIVFYWVLNLGDDDYFGWVGGYVFGQCVFFLVVGWVRCIFVGV